MKKLLKTGIEAGHKVKAVREAVKTYETQKQDMYDDTAEILKPSIDVQKSVKKTIDEKQDKIIKQLQENQEVLTEGLEANQRMIMFDREVPFAIEGLREDGPLIEFPETERPKRKTTILDIDNNFDKDDRIMLNNYNLLKPKDLTQVTPDRLQEERQKTVNIAKKIGGLKRRKNTTEDDIRSYNIELQTMKKYRETINDVLRSLRYVKTGQGIYTQKKRNAYKIGQNGQYGGLIIDLPKLYGQLKVIAHKNGQKVYDRQADFDTLNLLTKRYRSNRGYSQLARSVFNDLNRLSEIPIHTTSIQNLDPVLSFIIT